MTNAEVAATHTAAGGAAGTVEPYCPAVPDKLAERVDRLVEARQRRTGEDAKTARREVEGCVWLLGVVQVEKLEAR